MAMEGSESSEADTLHCVMEGQTGNERDRSNSSPTTTAKVHSISEDTASQSVPTLRFPRPQGSLHVANWVSSSSPTTMASTYSTDEDSGLSESSFELIPRDTDENSQDDRTDILFDSLYEHERFPHPDEVQAFNGLDDASTDFASSLASDFEPDEAEDNESLSAVYLPNLRTPFSQSSILQPIEFREPEDVDIHIDKISVKHTIKEFNEDEAAQVVETFDLVDSLGVDEVPRRLSATIRQTMSQRCLSTEEAFRVLYVGDEAVKGEIILKISRAITCSSSNDYNENKTLRRNTEGVYNIVPVTFGPSMDHDVELMEASGFQIKVDTCFDAEEIPIQGGYFREDIVYSLTVDGGNGGKKYKSVPAGGPEGFRVQPFWNLPHIVVVYCSEDDDEQIQKIQDATWAFCKRHAVPTLYISDHPAFMSPVAKRWLDRTHEHAVHLSLQSRELKKEHRFPIDLTSFLNIDNRQMNQNLAYLTGLEEAPPATDEKCKVISSQKPGPLGNKQCDAHAQKFKQHFAARNYNERLYPILLFAWLSVLSTLLGILITIIMPSTDSISTEHLTGVSMSHAPSILQNTPSAATATITVRHTSTKTVRVATLETPSFGGFLSDMAHTVSSETPKNTACSVQLYSSTEILIKIPAGTKESWLAKGAIDIDVFRDGNLIPSRLSTVDAGILVQIPFKESHGVLNVSIITTRKPKINETVAINFGTPRLYEILDAAKFALHSVAQKVGATADEAFKSIDQNYGSILTSADEQLMGKAVSWWDAIQGTRKTAQMYSVQIAQDTYNKVKGSIHMDGAGFSFNSGSATMLFKETQQKIRNQLQRAEDVREDAGLALLKAQISSKLWWLRVQGKSEQYEDYERLARNFMVNKHAQVVQDRKVRDSTRCPRTGSSKCQCKDHVRHTGRWKI